MRGGEKDRRVRVRAEGEASRLTLFNGLNPSLKTSIEDNLLFDNMFLFLTGGAGGGRGRERQMLHNNICTLHLAVMLCPIIGGGWCVDRAVT
jgi:hypothetical protein